MQRPEPPERTHLAGLGRPGAVLPQRCRHQPVAGRELLQSTLFHEPDRRAEAPAGGIPQFIVGGESPPTTISCGGRIRHVARAQIRGPTVTHSPTPRLSFLPPRTIDSVRSAYIPLILKGIYPDAINSSASATRASETVDS